MKTGKKIAVGLAAALAIAIFAGGAVSMVGAFPVPVQVNVVDGTDVSVEIGVDNGNFGDIIKGTPATLIESLTLTNVGTVDAKVEAKFLTSHDGTSGLVIEDTSVVPASSFAVGTTDNEIQLANNGDDVDLTAVNYVPGNGVVSYDAVLDVPGDQQVGIHTGIIELTFSAA